MITVHHLNFSRSTRVIWLLEELGLDYRLVRHARTPGFAAPQSLRAVHPLGKAPVIEDAGRTIAESSVILDYLNQTYGQGRLAPPFGDPRHLAHAEWLQWVEGAAAFPIMTRLYGTLTGGLPPVLETIIQRETRNVLSYLAQVAVLDPYLVGQDFSLADIQIAYVLDLADYLNLLGPYPILRRYLGLLLARPAFGRAVAAGGTMTPIKTVPSSAEQKP